MILVGAGPLVALVDEEDQHHAACVAALQELREPLGTLWPPLTEALYFLADQPRAQASVWDMLERGGLALLPLHVEDVPRIPN